MLRIASIGVLLTCFVLGCGSGSDAPPTFSVSGTITFDGQPVKSGEITFESDEKGVAPDAGPITDGKFSLKAKEGKKLVKIRAMREVPGKATKGAMGEDISAKEQYIPARYNEKTELVESVEAVSNSFDFTLKGDGAAK
ncbi:MAG: hypothetical protein JWM11_663 [Planctomycetaceae bacterium]|nr:hypothetical protein [Planctomycetaceae bacterium]